MAKIYTKVDDKGQTGLLGGQKVLKSHARIQTYGTVDELNSVLGWVRVALHGQVQGLSKSSGQTNSIDALAALEADLEKLQNWLFDLGGLLAAEPADQQKFSLAPVRPGQITWMEERIDAATGQMQPLKQFILPGGSEVAARLHMARTVSRRAERCLVAAAQESVELPENAVPFLNRLSDYLFTMARFANHLLGVPDQVWVKTQD